MDQNSTENETVASGAESAAAVAEAAPAAEAAPVAEVAEAAPARRRSRRATAATGEVVAAPVSATPAAEAAGAEVAAVVASVAAVEAPAVPAAAEAVVEAASEEPAPKKRATRSRKKPVEAEAVAETENVSAGDAAVAGSAAADAADAAAVAAAEEPAPKKRATRSRKKAVEAEADTAAADTAVAGPVAADAAVDTAAADAAAATGAAGETATESAAGADAAAAAEAPAAPAASTRGRRGRGTAAAKTAAGSAGEGAEAADGATAGTAGVKAGARGDAPSEGDAAQGSGEGSAEASGENGQGSQNGQQRQNGRGRGRGQRRQGENGDRNGSDRNADRSADRSGDAADKADGSDDSGNGSEQRGDSRGDQKSGENTRSSRTRQRERKRRGQGDDLEPEITEDDVLLPVAGILDVLDNYAFVRTSGYLPGTNDVYVSLGQVKKYGLRKGDAVVGAIRQPRESDGAGRQKYNAIVKIDSINSRPVEENQTRVDFADLTPINPDARLRLETDREQLTTRVIDLFAPIGLGQRGLITGARGAGKTSTLKQVAAAIAQNHPDAHVMVVLVDARPEEVTELQRSINGEVIASTFDRAVEDQTTVAELAIERAKRLVELGHDVVLLLDTVTRLGRSYQLAAAAHSRQAASSFDVSVLAPVKRLLGAARNVENGGSLTLLATASDQSTSNTDEVILEELENVWNMELHLSADLAAQRLFPAIDLAASSTRREELLTSEAEARVLNQVRRSVAQLGAQAGLESVLHKLGETSSNVEFLALVQRTQGL